MGMLKNVSPTRVMCPPLDDPFRSHMLHFQKILRTRSSPLRKICLSFVNLFLLKSYYIKWWFQLFRWCQTNLYIMIKTCTNNTTKSQEFLISTVKSFLKYPPYNGERFLAGAPMYFGRRTTWTLASGFYHHLMSPVNLFLIWSILTLRCNEDYMEKRSTEGR